MAIYKRWQIINTKFRIYLFTYLVWVPWWKKKTVKKTILKTCSHPPFILVGRGQNKLMPSGGWSMRKKERKKTDKADLVGLKEVD